MKTKLNKREQIIEMVKVLAKPHQELILDDLYIGKKLIDSIELHEIEGYEFFILNIWNNDLEFHIEDSQLKQIHLDKIIETLENLF